MEKEIISAEAKIFDSEVKDDKENLTSQTPKKEIREIKVPDIFPIDVLKIILLKTSDIETLHSLLLTSRWFNNFFERDNQKYKKQIFDSLVDKDHNPPCIRYSESKIPDSPYSSYLPIYHGLEKYKNQPVVNYVFGKKEGIENIYLDSDYQEIIKGKLSDNNKVPFLGSIVNYEKGLKNGTQIFYSKDSDITGTLSWIKGKKEGREDRWYIHGQRQSYSFFVNDLQEGVSIWWFELSNLFSNEKDDSYYIKILDSTEIETLPNDIRQDLNKRISAVVRYRNGKKNGKAEEFYDTGKLKSRCFWKDDKKEGDEETYIFYDEKNNPFYKELYTVTHYVDGIKDGVEKRRDRVLTKKGDVPYHIGFRTINWKKGLKDGLERISPLDSTSGDSQDEYHDTNWKEGKRDGEEKIVKKGNVTYRCQWKDNKKHGIEETINNMYGGIDKVTWENGIKVENKEKGYHEEKKSYLTYSTGQKYFVLGGNY